ncbi:MAG TPA: TIGR03013 family XrtA/PEP-CTERM system glycosyltransferase [Vicinamibacterales bacterium]|nr:TIGR03013 family XrtA/PEP-CTERM system glycosyltransferase [Vicinamibacterales bacterium]
MIRGLTSRQVLLVAFETVLIVSAVAIAAYVRLGESAWTLLVNRLGLSQVLILAGVTQTCLYYADLYDFRVVADRRELFIRILQALGTASFILAGIYFWFPDMMVGRGVFLGTVVLVIVFVLSWRVLFDWLDQRVAPRERLLLVGTSDAAVTLAKELHDRRHELGVNIVGFVDPDPARVGAPVLNPGVIGVVDDIPAIVESRGVDRVVVSLADARGKLPMNRLLEMKLGGGVTFDHLASVYEEYTGKIAVENLRPSWLIFSEGFHKSRAVEIGKRLLDVVFAILLIALTGPIMLLVALLVRLTSKGPALYHQKRVGLNGHVFEVHKFRSMRTDAEAGTGAVWARANDSRVTPIGRFLRRTRLDELPQLWNVLKGDMSLVGPRPERPEFVADLTEKIPFYGFRHVVRPGLTGWAQVRYTYGASVEDALEKLQYDLFYIKHLSVSFDLFVLFSTVKTVILRRGAQ